MRKRVLKEFVWYQKHHCLISKKLNTFIYTKCQVDLHLCKLNNVLPLVLQAQAMWIHKKAIAWEERTLESWLLYLWWICQGSFPVVRENRSSATCGVLHKAVHREGKCCDAAQNCAYAPNVVQQEWYMKRTLLVIENKWDTTLSHTCCSMRTGRRSYWNLSNDFMLVLAQLLWV